MAAVIESGLIFVICMSPLEKLREDSSKGIKYQVFLLIRIAFFCSFAKYLGGVSPALFLTYFMREFELIAKTFQGLEEVLAKELVALGANNVQIGRRMVSFTGDKAMMYKANFHLRTAVRILKPIMHFKAANADEVYNVIKSVDWEQYLDCNSTFSVDSVVYSDVFRHSKFVAYRVKDAIADFFNVSIDYLLGRTDNPTINR